MLVRAKVVLEPRDAEGRIDLLEDGGKALGLVHLSGQGSAGSTDPISRVGFRIVSHMALGTLQGPLVPTQEEVRMRETRTSAAGYAQRVVPDRTQQMLDCRGWIA